MEIAMCLALSCSHSWSGCYCIILGDEYCWKRITQCLLFLFVCLLSVGWCCLFGTYNTELCSLLSKLKTKFMSFLLSLYIGIYTCESKAIHLWKWSSVEEWSCQIPWWLSEIAPDVTDVWLNEFYLFSWICFLTLLTAVLWLVKKWAWDILLEQIKYHYRVQYFKRRKIIHLFQLILYMRWMCFS